MADVRIDDFSAGETDRFRDGNPIFSKTLKNLYVSENKKLTTRPGYKSLYSDIDPFGAQRVNLIWSHCTTRETLGTVAALQKYESFVESNRSFQVQNSVGDGWRTATLPGVTNPADTVTILSQPNYIRLNDNEFVLTQSNNSLGSYPLKFYRESTTTEWKTVSLGLPFYKNTVQVASLVAGGNDWLYAIVLKHTYTLFEEGAGFVTKEVRGEPAFTDINLSVSSLDVVVPSFTSADGANYKDNQGREIFSDASFDYGSIVWEVYRTTSKGTIFYKLGEVANTGGNYSDAELDADITDGALLYTTGGVVANQMSNGRVEFGTYANNTLWLGSKTRVWQAKVGIHDAVNGSFNFQGREGEKLISMRTIDVYPMLFSNKGAFRVEGIVDDLGNGSHRVRTVSETDGALSNKTTIKADNKIFYLSSDGIYATNGYTSSRVSKHYVDRYKALISRTGLVSGVEYHAYEMASGCYDECNKRVHWFFPAQGGEYLTDTLTLDLKYPNDEGLSIQSGTVPFSVTDVNCEQGLIQAACNLGQVVGQEQNTYDDVDADVDQTETTGIPWTYESTSMSFGSALIRKWFTRLLLNLTNLTDLTFRVQSDTDESNDWREHNTVKERGFTRGLYLLKRWFPKGKLRGTYKTIRFTNEAQVLQKSDTLGNATVAGLTATLNAGTFPEAVPSGYFISFSIDSYAAKHRVNTDAAIGATTLLLDTAPTGGSYQWEITGIPQNERIELNGYTVLFASAGEGHTQSDTTAGGNE